MRTVEWVDERTDGNYEANSHFSQLICEHAEEGMQ